MLFFAVDMLRYADAYVYMPLTPLLRHFAACRCCYATPPLIFDTLTLFIAFSIISSLRHCL